MGNTRKPRTDRREFFTRFLSHKQEEQAQKVKLLTADGKLVEIDKSVLDAATNRVKADNQAIYNWMENPSKDKQ